MKLLLLQTRPMIGDFSRQVDTIQKAFSHAQKESVDLIVTSELFLTGYFPKDLLRQDSFIQASLDALQAVLDCSQSFPDQALIVGIPMHTKTGKGLSNTALLIQNGTILHRQDKRLLPYDDIFDEPRYFEPSLSYAVIPFKEEILGICICEDAWADDKKTYLHHPVADLVSQGATLIINLSASPFYQGKPELRMSVFSDLATRYQIPIVMVNQTGGQDEVLFDGGSFVLNAKGDCTALASFFKEDFLVTSTLSQKQQEKKMPSCESQLVRAVVTGIQDFVQNSSSKTVLLGLSGGIDSAVVATLAVEALGSKQVTGVLMPSPYSSKESVIDATALAKNLGISTCMYPITEIMTTMDRLQPLVRVAAENRQSRIRAMILMGLANQTESLVLATSNKSEVAMGYATLYGDMSGALLPIGDLYKIQVYQVAHWLNSNREVIPKNSLSKPPSAELSPNQVDTDTLPPYPILDAILSAFLEEGCDTKSIIGRGFKQDIVTWVLERLSQQEFKRWQAPPILKLSNRAFGSGWRMPLSKYVAVSFYPKLR